MSFDGAEILDNIEPQFFFTKQHIGYINSISIDTEDHKLLLCGGADSSITIWDLDEKPDPTDDETVYTYKDVHSKPLCRLKRNESHKFGISKIMWWPFGNEMFISGSYDTTVKAWDSEQLEDVYSFALDNKVYCLDCNPLDSTGLVCVGLDHPIIRLLDLRVGGSAQALKGHTSGSVCSVKWSPTRDYMLASGGTDGTVRIWDIRQAKQQVASMDLSRTNVEQPLTPLEFRKAHRAVCNGLAWHPSGDELLSMGLDNKVRIWDLTGVPGGGTNKSINFGPLFQNRRQQNIDPCMTFEGDLGPVVGEESEEEFYVFLPSETGDILMSQYSDGKLVRRLTPPGRDIRLHRQAAVVSRGPKLYEFYSTTVDGSLLRWKEPPDEEPEPEPEPEPDENETNNSKGEK